MRNESNVQRLGGLEGFITWWQEATGPLLLSLDNLVQNWGVGREGCPKALLLRVGTTSGILNALHQSSGWRGGPCWVWEIQWFKGLSDTSHASLPLGSHPHPLLQWVNYIENTLYLMLWRCGRKILEVNITVVNHFRETRRVEGNVESWDVLLAWFSSSSLLVPSGNRTEAAQQSRNWKVSQRRHI